jgi:hypothetical protein
MSKYLMPYYAINTCSKYLGLAMQPFHVSQGVGAKFAWRFVSGLLASRLVQTRQNFAAW